MLCCIRLLEVFLGNATREPLEKSLSTGAEGGTVQFSFRNINLRVR